MVESAWQGNGGTWNKRVGYYGEENMQPLFALLKWCNENNIPTVFGIKKILSISIVLLRLQNGLIIFLQRMKI